MTSPVKSPEKSPENDEGPIPGPLRASGQPIHTRSLNVELRRSGESGLLARGSVIDLRKRGFMPTTGGVQSAGIIHHMTLELEIEPASRAIRRVEVDQPTVAFEPTDENGGECCRDPAPRLFALHGQVLDAGFPGFLSQHFGGALGCSHLLTLAQLMGSVLPRALSEEERIEDRARRRPGERIFQRLLVLDGFEISEGELCVLVQLSDAHSRPLPPEGSPMQRISHQREAQLLAHVATPAMQVTRCHAITRERDLADFATARFESRDDRLAWLVGRPLFGGIAGEALRRLRSSEQDDTLRDLVLNLAPGTIQCLAATIDRTLERMMRERDPAAPTRDGETRRRLQSEAVGGQPDSCYMWRRGGPLLSVRTGDDSAGDAG